MNLKTLLWLHRAILWCYPRAFRRRRGPAVLRLSAQRIGRAARRRRGVFIAWASTAADLVQNLFPAWLASERKESDGETRMNFALVGISLKRSLRGVSRNPGFSGAVALAIGLSVGAAAGVLAIVDVALLTPLPYEEPAELIVMTETSQGDRISSSYPNFLDWKRDLGSFDDLAMFVRENVTLTGEGPAARLPGLAISSNLFQLLGVPVALGRGIRTAGDTEGGPGEAVLTDHLWKSHFGSDPNVLGRSILIDQLPFEVVGVAPQGFQFPDGIVYGKSDLFLSISSLVPEWGDRGSHPGIYVLGRLRDGVDLQIARDEANQLALRLSQVHPENDGAGIEIRPVTEEILGTLPNALLLLSISAGLVLLIGFGNAAGLFLSRMVGGRSDKSVSRALGASRRDMTLELVVDGLVFGILAGVTAVGSAGLLIRLFRDDLANYPRLEGLSLGVPIIGVTMLSAVLISMIVVLLPWTRSFFRGPIDPVASRGALNSSPAKRRLQNVLVCGQVALAVLLLAGAGVLLRSFSAMSADDGGVRPTDVVTLRTSLPALEYEGPRTLVFYDELREQVQALPGVQAVGGISTLPFSGSGSQSRTAPDGVGTGDGVRTDVNVVLGDYFDAMGVELLAGRPFGPEDGPESAPVVIVDERLAARFWPGDSPIGKTLSGWGLESAEVVGLARHVKNYGVTRESRDELYMPHAQRPFLSMYLIVRSDRKAESLLSPIRQVVTGLDSDIPVIGGRSMKGIVEFTIATPRLAAHLGSVMSILAALLAFLGAYALIAHSVAQRTRELGLRMALGAHQSAVARMVLREGIGIAIPGALVGLGGAFVGSSVLEGFVYGVSSRDPVSMAGGAATVLALVLLAAYLPARRAATIDPLLALRSE